MMVTSCVMKCCLLSCQKNGGKKARLKRKQGWKQRKKRKATAKVAQLNEESPHLQGTVQHDKGRESRDRDKGCGEQELLTTPPSSLPVAPNSHRHTHAIKDQDRKNVFEWFSLYLSSYYICWTSKITHIYQNPKPADPFYFIPTSTNLISRFLFCQTIILILS